MLILNISLACLLQATLTFCSTPAPSYDTNVIVTSIVHNTTDQPENQPTETAVEHVTSSQAETNSKSGFLNRLDRLY